MASPDIASGPTPCPMKMLSTILYKEEAVWAMMAGRAYCFSSFPMFSVPSSVGMEVFDAILLRFVNYFDFKDERSISRNA